MNNNRINNSKRNILFGAMSKVALIIFPFFVRTAMMQVLGAEYLGLNSVCHSLLSVLNLAELGLSSAIIFSLYKPIAAGDSETICALLNFYKRVYKIIGLFILSVGLIILPFIRFLIKDEIPQGLNLYIVFLIYLCNTVVSYLFFAYKNALLTAYQRSDVISKISIISNLLLNVLQLFIIVTFKNYYLSILIMPFITLINNLITAYVVDKMFPELKPVGKIEKNILDDIAKRVKGLLIQNVCGMTRNSLDSMVISTFLGLVSVAKYTNYYYIMNSVHSFLYVITEGIVASVGDSMATESVEKNYNDMNKLTFLYAWISGWCTVCLFCLYQPFMELWMGKDMLLSPVIVGLFCFYFYMLTTGDIRTQYTKGAGLWWEGRYRALAETLLNVVLNIILARYWGIAGVVLATIIALTFINFGYGSTIVFRYYFKNGKLLAYYGRHFIYLVVTIIVTAICYAACNAIEGTVLHMLFGRACICVVLPNIIYFVIYCRTKIFAESTKLIKKVIGK